MKGNLTDKVSLVYQSRVWLAPYPFFILQAGRYFPASASDMFLLKSSEFSFISHDSVLKPNDLRTVSINRILYRHNGQISPISDTYKQIETLVLKKYFPRFQYDFEQLLQTISDLNQKVTALEEKENNLTEENQQLQAEIESLKAQLILKSE